MQSISKKNSIIILCVIVFVVAVFAFWVWWYFIHTFDDAGKACLDNKDCKGVCEITNSDKLKQLSSRGIPIDPVEFNGRCSSSMKSSTGAHIKDGKIITK